MKCTILFYFALMLSFNLSYCQSICGCLDITIKMMEEMKLSDFDIRESEIIQRKYQNQIDSCETKAGELFESEDEQEAALLKCSNYERIEALNLEQINAINRQYGVEEDTSFEDYQVPEGISVCSCVELIVESLTKAKSVNFDKKRMDEMKDEYAIPMKQCELFKLHKYEDEELFNEEMAACPDFLEMTKLGAELIKALNRQMDEELEREGKD